MLTLSRLKERLHYDPETGIFTWLGSWRRGPVDGRKAGHINALGYLVIEIDDKPYLGQRLAWFYVHGKWPDGDLDHENRIRSDNKLLNLREATRAQNTANSGARNKLGIKGVRVTPSGRFTASIGTKGKMRHLGTFPTAKEAARVFVEAHQTLYGKFSPRT